MIGNKRFGLFIAGLLVAVPALYAAQGQADPQKSAAPEARKERAKPARAPAA